MDIILNDYSLCGQFKNIEEFEDNLTDDIIPLMKHFDEAHCLIHKSEKSFDNRVTKEYTLIALLQMRGSPQLQRVKSLLSRLIFDEPFWVNEYSNNCLTEANEKKGILLSFKHEDFLKENIELPDNKITIKNAFNSISGLDHLFESSNINETYYYTSLNLRIVIEFLIQSTTNYAQIAFDNNNITHVDKIRIREKMKNLFNCIIDKTPLTQVGKNLGNGLCEFRCDVSDNRILRVFFVINNNKLVFLNGFIKKSQKTPNNELEKARKLMKLVNFN